MTRMPLYAPLSATCTAFPADRLSEALCFGARSELLLTPKPGLVDLYDNGSHSDLDLVRMQRSIDLMPVYYAELLNEPLEPLDVERLQAIGMRAEARMREHCDTNTHRGYLFLSGIILIALRLDGDIRLGIIRLSERLFKVRKSEDSHGQQVRQRYQTGGIIGECLRGLPTVFEHALPCYRRQRQQHGDEQRAALAMMATLMQVTEDTTSYHRCGQAGIEQVRADGVELEQRLLGGETVESWLCQRNSLYQQMNLTMGGVADLIAICFALDRLQIAVMEPAGQDIRGRVPGLPQPMSPFSNKKTWIKMP
ncbi:MAG: triphosphoribosyl-dephospho-CoA synthase [Desulfuromonas sp.]|nr:triphosphoribosyl-dephospho-CoA synthase [Desulfuromonas sp.]